MNLPNGDPPEPKAQSPRSRAISLLVFLLSLSTAALSGCRAQATPEESEPQVSWHTLGTWSGHGNAQTESFIFDSGTLRVRWETLNEPRGRKGEFRLVLLSAVSGRHLAVAVEQQGIGKGESFVSENPRQAYMLIESSDVDWSFSVDEGTIGTPRRTS